MATEAQILAKRRNAPKSTGPGRPPMEKTTPNLTTFMQNKPNFQKAQMRLNSILAKDYVKNPAFGLRKNKANFKIPQRRIPACWQTPIMQNKANLPDAKMSVNVFAARDYGDFAALRLRENKANFKGGNYSLTG